MKCKNFDLEQRATFSHVNKFRNKFSFLFFFYITDSTKRIGEQFEILSTGINSYKVATEYIDCRPILVCIIVTSSPLQFPWCLSLRVTYNAEYNQKLWPQRFNTVNNVIRFATLIIHYSPQPL